MYHERRGHGAPLVLLHGAMATIESFAGLLPALAHHFEMIAVELQGHGRTRDVDRPMTYEGMARDLTGLLDGLGIERAHFVGYSLGGAVALQLALDRPDLVDHLVFAGGAAFDTSGLHPRALGDLRVVRPTRARRNPMARGLPWRGARPRRVALTRSQGEGLRARGPRRSARAVPARACHGGVCGDCSQAPVRIHGPCLRGRCTGGDEDHFGDAGAG